MPDTLLFPESAKAIDPSDGSWVLRVRHPEWTEHQKTWRFLADSLEGGRRYRDADYSHDPLDQKAPPDPFSVAFSPDGSVNSGLYSSNRFDRNLIPHLQEMTSVGWKLYLSRLARTPVPDLVGRSVASHVGKIYSQEVMRRAPDSIEDWWNDVDGRGSNIDRWIQEVFAPLFLSLGFLDVAFSRPEWDGPETMTLADAQSIGADRCLVSVIMPENVPWWTLNRDGSYRECLVFVRDYSNPVGAHYQHWTMDVLRSYDAKGRLIKSKSWEHGLGFVPIVRIFDARLARCENSGKSRYMSIADYMRAVYNGDSERCLVDINTSSPTLSGPSQYVEKGEVKVGPSAVLPKAALTDPSGMVAGYEGWEYVEPSGAGAESIRQHIQDWQDQADRDARLSRPAGMVDGRSVAQSGISKRFDAESLNALLSSVASSLQQAEYTFVKYVSSVIGGSPVGPETVKVVYPSEFDLYSSEEVAFALDALQRASQQAGALPTTEALLIRGLAKSVLVGIQDDTLRAIESEVDAMVKGMSQLRKEDDGRSPELPDDSGDDDDSSSPDRSGRGGRQVERREGGRIESRE